MDGAPYLRKVDLRTYATYQELSSALEKMFSCFTIGEHFLFKSRCHISPFFLILLNRGMDKLVVISCFMN